MIVRDVIVRVVVVGRVIVKGEIVGSLMVVYDG